MKEKAVIFHYKQQEEKWKISSTNLINSTDLGINGLARR